MKNIIQNIFLGNLRPVFIFSGKDRLKYTRDFPNIGFIEILLFFLWAYAKIGRYNV